MNKYVRLSVICTFSFSIAVLAGCSTARVVYSEPFIFDERIKRYDDTKFRLDDLDFMVVPHNHEYSYGFLWYIVPILPLPGSNAFPRTQDFTFHLVLDPEGEKFSFDLSQVILEIDGTKLSPTHYVGPVGRRFYQGNSWECDNKNADWKAIRDYPTRPLPIQEWSCFTFTFSALTPSPEKPFNVFLNGVQRNQMPFPIPPIHFKEGYSWSTQREL